MSSSLAIRCFPGKASKLDIHGINTGTIVSLVSRLFPSSGSNSRGRGKKIPINLDGTPFGPISASISQAVTGHHPSALHSQLQWKAEKVCASVETSTPCLEDHIQVGWMNPPTPAVKIQPCLFYRVKERADQIWDQSNHPCGRVPTPKMGKYPAGVGVYWVRGNLIGSTKNL